MKYRVGLDFGTTATKIAYLDGQDRLQAFRYPGPTGAVSIPSVLEYQATEHAGERHRPAALPSMRFHIPEDGDYGASACEHFKVLLPLVRREQWATQGWSVDLSPEEVTRAYFRQLLHDKLHSFTRQVGAIDTVVIALPHAWLETPDHRGKQILQRLFSQEFGVANLQFHSEARCAAAYIAHCYQQRHHRALVGTLLVCDLGGGSFQVALCRVHGQHIEVVDHDGDRAHGLSVAGAAFDRSLALTAYTAVHGVPPSPHCAHLHTFRRAFATVKVREHDTLLQLLALQQKTTTLSDTPLYVVQNTYTVDGEQLRRSFQPLATHIVAILARLLARATVRKRSIDHVVLVGEGSRLPLVLPAILTQLD